MFCQKVKFNYKAAKCQECSRFIFINILCLRGHKIYYYVTKNLHKQFLIAYFSILDLWFLCELLGYFFLNNN